MSQRFEITGKIHSIGDTTEYGQNGFTKREFVLLMTGENENPSFPNYIALELIKDRCALLDSYNVGEEIKVSFNLSGRLWQAQGKPERCFTSLQAWKIDRLGQGQDAAPATYDDAPFGQSFDDDVPF